MEQLESELWDCMQWLATTKTCSHECKNGGCDSFCIVSLELAAKIQELSENKPWILYRNEIARVQMCFIPKIPRGLEKYEGQLTARQTKKLQEYSMKYPKGFKFVFLTYTNHNAHLSKIGKKLNLEVIGKTRANSKCKQNKTLYICNIDFRSTFE